MPVPTTNPELFELIAKSGVLDDARLKAYLDGLSVPVPADPIVMGEWLVRDGLLTHFQAEQLLQGRWKRFSIGKYKVLERLGVGGMGQVFLCEHKLMKRRVAVKVLPVAKAKDEAALQRFYREARAVAAVDHPNIARAYDIDEDGDLHFLVMEYVDGINLYDLTKLIGPLPWLRAAHYVYGAAVGLQHAHEMGLVHRDVKPANILVDRGGVVKLLDMGLARFFDAKEDDHLTKKYDENVLGTADYLAPEQALDSSSVDIRADLYALGGTFYFMLTGQPLFPDGSVAQKLLWHQSRVPQAIPTFRSDVPPPVVAMIEKLLMKIPQDRYQTPSELMAALGPWIQTPIPPPADDELPKLSIAASGRSAGSGASLQVSASNHGTIPVAAVPPSQSQPANKVAAKPKPAPSVIAGLPTLPTTRSHGFAPAAVPAAPVETGGGLWESITGGPPPGPVKGSKARVPSPLPAVEEAKRDEDEDSPRSRRKPPKKKSNLGLILGLIAGGLLILGAAVTVLVLMLNAGKPTSSEPDPTKPVAEDRRTIAISSSGQGAPADATLTLTSLGELAKHGGIKAGDTILIVDEAIEFGPILLIGKAENVRIEAANPAKNVAWKFNPKAKSGATIPPAISINGCRDVTIKGFTIDLDGQPDSAIVATGDCSGLTLANITLLNAASTGIRLGNAKGTAEKPLTIEMCRVAGSTKLEQALHLFNAEHVRVLDSRWEGNGTGTALLIEGVQHDVAIRQNRLFKFESGARFAKIDEKKPGTIAFEQNTVHAMAKAGLLADATLTAPAKVTLSKNYFSACTEAGQFQNDKGAVRAANNGRDSATKPGTFPNPPVEIKAPVVLNTDPNASDAEFLRSPAKPQIGNLNIGSGS